VSVMAQETPALPLDGTVLISQVSTMCAQRFVYTA